MVPKSISLTLVTHSKDNIQKELLQELYKPEVLDDLLKESQLVVERRAEVVKMLGALNKAEEYVLSFLDLCLLSADLCSVSRLLGSLRMFRGLYTCTYSSVSSVVSLTGYLRPVLSVRLRLLVVFVFPYAVVFSLNSDSWTWHLLCFEF